MSLTGPINYINNNIIIFSLNQDLGESKKTRDQNYKPVYLNGWQPCLLIYFIYIGFIKRRSNLTAWALHPYS